MPSAGVWGGSGKTSTPETSSTPRSPTKPTAPSNPRQPPLSCQVEESLPLSYCLQSSPSYELDSSAIANVDQSSIDRVAAAAALSPTFRSSNDPLWGVDPVFNQPEQESPCLSNAHHESLRSLLDVFDISVLNSLDQAYFAANEDSRAADRSTMAEVHRTESECGSSSDESNASSANTTVAARSSLIAEAETRQDHLSLFAPDSSLGLSSALPPSRASSSVSTFSSTCSTSPSSHSSSSSFSSLASSFTNPSSLSSSRITSGVRLLTPTSSLRDLNTPPFPPPDQEEGNREDSRVNQGEDPASKFVRKQERRDVNANEFKEEKQSSKSASGSFESAQSNLDLNGAKSTTSSSSSANEDGAKNGKSSCGDILDGGARPKDEPFSLGKRERSSWSSNAHFEARVNQRKRASDASASSSEDSAHPRSKLHLSELAMLVKPKTVASFVDNPPMATSTPCFGASGEGDAPSDAIAHSSTSHPKRTDDGASPSSSDERVVGPSNAQYAPDDLRGFGSLTTQKAAATAASAPRTNAPTERSSIYERKTSHVLQFNSAPSSRARFGAPFASSAKLETAPIADNPGSNVMAPHERSGNLHPRAPASAASSIAASSRFGANRPPTPSAIPQNTALFSNVNLAAWGHPLLAPTAASGLVHPPPINPPPLIGGQSTGWTSSNQIPLAQENAVSSTHEACPNAASRIPSAGFDVTNRPAAATGATARVDTTFAVELILRSPNTAFRAHPLFPLLQDINVVLQSIRENPDDRQFQLLALLWPGDLNKILLHFFQNNPDALLAYINHQRRLSSIWSEQNYQLINENVFGQGSGYTPCVENLIHDALTHCFNELEKLISQRRRSYV